MRKSFLLCALTVALLSFPMVPCRAQRQTPGRASLDAYVSLGWPSEGKFGVTGGGLFWHSHGFIGYSAMGLDLSVKPVSFSRHTEPVYDLDGNMVAPGSDETFVYRGMDLCLSQGYYFRIVSTRDRTLIVSAGINVREGARLCPDARALGNSAAGFVLSFVPDLVVEVFPFRSVSWFASVNCEMTAVDTMVLSGAKQPAMPSCPWFRYGFHTGLKLYL